jgi:hypothetical protein
MTPRFAVTRTLPKPALSLLRAAGETWVSDCDRPLSREEFLDAVVGAEALLTLLYDRVDGELLDAAGPSAMSRSDMTTSMWRPPPSAGCW